MDFLLQKFDHNQTSVHSIVEDMEQEAITQQVSVEIHSEASNPPVEEKDFKIFILPFVIKSHKMHLTFLCSEQSLYWNLVLKG